MTKTMTVAELQAELSKYNPTDEVFVVTEANEDAFGVAALEDVPNVDDDGTFVMVYTRKHRR